MSILLRMTLAARSALLRSTGGLGAAAREEIYRRIWSEAAHELAADLESLGDGFFEIRLGERKTRVREHLAMIDHPASVAVGRNKPLAHRLLSAEGLSVPPHCEFGLDHLAPARAFLRECGGLCVVKPARDSGGGDGVTANVHSTTGLVRAALRASLYSRRLLIERQIEGDCYRLLFLDGRLLDALRRRPPRVVGDGRSTLRELVDRENERRIAGRGRSSNKRITRTTDCRTTLRRAGLSLRSVPASGAVVPVKTTTNESAAMDCESVCDEIGDALWREAAAAARILDLRLAGVDVITPDPARSLTETRGAILEVNPSPGLHYHYQTANAGRPVAVSILRTLLAVEARDSFEARSHRPFPAREVQP